MRMDLGPHYCVCPSMSIGRYDLKEPDHAVLVFGDSGGGVGTCQFFTATSSLFPVRTNTACRNQGR